MKKLVKNSLMGVSMMSMSFTGLALTSGVALTTAACGEDTIECGGHGNQCPRKEGGEIRLEYFTKPNGDSVARATSMFIADQEVDYYNSPQANECNYRLQKDFWPFAQSPGRTYVDAGEEVVISSDATTDFVTVKGSGKDFLVRDHDILYTDTLPEASEDYTEPNTIMDVQLNGEGPHGELYEDWLFMPGDWEYTGDSVHGLKTFVEGQDHLIEWTTEPWTNLPAEDFGATMLMGLIDPEFGGPIVLCVTPFGNGNFTIKFEVYDQLPTDGLLMMGAVSHSTQFFGDREVDFIGMNCKVQPYTITAAQ